MLAEAIKANARVRVALQTLEQVVVTAADMDLAREDLRHAVELLDALALSLSRAADATL